jgi:ABC-type nickel/cobalt efflux system permease component RcnA
MPSPVSFHNAVELPAVLLQCLGLIGAVEELPLEQLHSDDSEDEHEEHVDNENVEHVLQGVDHTVKHSLREDTHTHKHTHTQKHVFGLDTVHTDDYVLTTAVNTCDCRAV